MALIYGLSSSEDLKNIRYVGKATNLEDRLRRHLSNYYLQEDTRKTRWIKSQLKKGNTIHIALLEEVSDNAWQEAEVLWIKKLKEKGFDLTNGTDGGEGIKDEFGDTISKRNETRKKNNLEAKKIEIEKFKIVKEDEWWRGERKCIKCSSNVTHYHKGLNELIYLLRKSINRPGWCCKGVGRKLTNDDKRKISESKKYLSQETRDKFSKLHSGKIISDEMKEKLRKANLGKKQSQETIDKRVAHRKTKIICTTNNKEYNSIKEACVDLNCSSASVIKVLRQEQMSTKGYSFTYKENGKN